MRSNARPRVLAVLAAVGLTAIGVASATPAVAAPAPAAVTCPVGYVCLVPTVGALPVLVPAGTTRTFSPALSIRDAINRTSVNYCVLGSLSFQLPAGAEIARPDTVVAVAPGQFCLQ